MSPVPLHNMTPDGLSLRTLDRASPEVTVENVERLRRTQEQLGFSYREMAARLGVHRNTYLNWIRGVHSVPPMVFMALQAMMDEIIASQEAKTTKK